MRTVYLDNAATSFPKPECVYNAMDRFNRTMGASPGRGTSRRVQNADAIVFEAREALAALFGIRDNRRIALGLNVTEALNTGLKGLLNPGDHVLTSSMEHNAVARPLTALMDQGIEWTAVPCAPDGTIDPEDIRGHIQANTRMICMLHASNVNGTIMPIEEIGIIARENGLIFMVDTAQTAGVLPLDVEKQKIDLLAFTGHKSLLGPQGAGGLYVREGLKLRPLKQGGTGSRSEELTQPDFMPDQLESGTPNTPGIAGLGAGVGYISETGLDKIRSREKRLLELLLDGLREIRGLQLYGLGDADRQTAVVSFNISHRDCGEISMQLDYDYGIITRSGLHCAPLAHRTMGTLRQGTCRLSPGYFNTEEDIIYAIQAVAGVARSS